MDQDRLTLARRAVALAVATLALFAPAATPAHTLGEPTVKSGRWHGIKWELTANTGSDGSYCIVMTVRRTDYGRSCGSIRNEGISYLTHTGRPGPAYVVGPVIGKARSVQIAFFDRRPIRISTIAPPRTLYQGIRFFTAILPCPATARSVVAWNAAGRIVARIAIPRPAPKLSC